MSEGLTKEKIKEYVEYIFREKPLEDAKKGEGVWIEVNTLGSSQSFRVVIADDPDSERFNALYTGIEGFLDMCAASNMLMSMHPVKYNGVFLEGDDFDAFWKEMGKHVMRRGIHEKPRK